MTAVRVARPAILAALDGARIAVIEASAGTGKTYTLEHLVVDLLLRGLRIDEILVVTFTEKATTELRARVRKKIGEVLRARPEDSAAEGVPAWVVDDAGRSALRKALAGFDGASIATIHAFCQRALAENAFAGGRLFEESSVDAREGFARAFREALREDLAKPGNEAAALLRVALAGPRRIDQVESLLFACSRHVGRVEYGFDGPRLREALAEFGDLSLQEQVRAEMARAKVHGGTVKKVTRLVQELGDVARAFASHGNVGAALADLEEVGDGPGFEGEYLADKLGAVRDGGACAKLARAARAVAAYGSLDGALARELLPSVMQRFRRRKDEAGLLDFDDMLRLVRDSLPRLVPGLRARYRAALIDEFQDTDPVQWEVFRELFLDHEPASLYLVGDPKQAIYGFRGGDVHTYLAAREEVRRRGGRVVPLAENHRSTAAVIAAYNHVLEGFFSAPGVAYDVPVTCGDAGLVATGAPVTLVRAGEATKSATAVWDELGPALTRVVRDVLQGDPPPLLVGGGRGGRPLEPPRPREVFVLTNRGAEARRAATLLRAAGVSCAFYKEDGLLRGAEARAVMHLFAGLARPHERSCRRKAWLSPFFAVPLKDLARADELPPSHPLHATLARLAQLAEARQHGRLFAELAGGTGVVRRALFEGDERALENLLHVLELALEHAGRRAATVDEVARDLEAFVAGRRLPDGDGGDVQRVPGDADAVQLMTVHKSKGLEADVVVIAGGLTPGMADRHARFFDGAARVLHLGVRTKALAEQASREREEEEERLLYVAMTRAKARLVLPLLGGPGKDGYAPRGPYRRLNARLREIVDEGPSPLFEPLRAGDLAARASTPPPGESALAQAIARWRPPEALLAIPEPSPAPRALAAARGGIVITSYSQLKRAGDATNEAAPELDPFRVRDVVPDDGDDLPGGTATGLFLHEVLEEADLATARGSACADWAIRERSLLARAAARHGVDARHLPRAATMAHAALTLPTWLGSEASPVPIAEASRVLRELEFLYTVPGAPHLVKGYLDVVFEHEGRAWVLDWKSDRLARYDAVAIGNHTSEHYALQGLVYSVALARMLRVDGEAAWAARFGGVVFRFLRAPADEPRAGVAFARPSWSEVSAFAAGLAGRLAS